LFKRRKALRFKVSKVTFSYRLKGLFKNPWRKVQVNSIGPRGLSINSMENLSAHSFINGLIWYPFEEKPIKVKARVAWVKDRNIGLDIVKIKEKDREKLTEEYYLRQLLKAKDSSLK